MLNKRNVNNVVKAFVAGFASFLVTGTGFMVTAQYKKFLAYFGASIILSFAELGSATFFVICLINANNTISSQILIWVSGIITIVFLLLISLVWALSIVLASLDAYNEAKMVDALITVD